MARVVVALIVAIVAAAAADAQTPPSTFVLDNGVVRATFAGEPGREHELASIERRAGGREIRFLTSSDQPRASAGWGVLLRDRREPLAAHRCTWLFADDPRFVIARESDPTHSGKATAMTVTYAAERLEVDGVPFTMTITARWRLPPGGAFLEGSWTIETPGLASLPFYVSQVTAPSLFVRELFDASHSHELVIPSQGGLLLRDPLLAPRFPRRFAGKGDGKPWIVPWVQVPLLAYYDATLRDGLLLTDDDVTGCFRDYEVVRRESNGIGRFLELRCRHLPEDLYTRETWPIPYRARIEPLAGDWVDVARTYRAFLADPASGATFYKGPIGARADVRPEMKDLVFHAYVEPGIRSDSLDRLARDALDTVRLAGAGGTMHVWSAGFHPDEFEQFYFQGWLPGRPSLAAAVREAQESTATIVAPYVNSIAGVDYVAAGVTEPTPLMRTIRAAALITEEGKRFRSTLGPIPALGECNGDPEWSRVFVENVVDVVRHTGARSIYLDAFTTAPCFASDASTGRHAGHRPGGGGYVHQARLAQLRAIRRSLAATQAPFAGFVMEGHCLWYIGDVEVMHLRPEQVAVTVGNEERGTPPAAANVRAIPFFRMVADSVKLAPFEEREAPSLGQRAWLTAVDVFAFGMLPNGCNNQVDLFASYGDPHLRGRAPLERYVRRIVATLRGGLLRFHNGTLERSPPVRVDARGFVPPSSVGSAAAAARTPPWCSDAVVVGLFRGPPPAGGAAFVATNPWIATPGADEIDVATQIRPGDCGIRLEDDGYVVTLHDEDGRELEAWPRTTAETFPIAVSIPAGAIRYWIFRD